MNDVTLYIVLIGQTVYLRMDEAHANTLIEMWVRYVQGALTKEQIKEWGQCPVIAGVGFGVRLSSINAMYHSGSDSRELHDLENKVKIATCKATLRQLEDDYKLKQDDESKW